MTDEKNQAERPDHWLTETTTPGLLVQVDVNSGETEPVFAGAAAPREGQPLTGFDLIRQTFPGIKTFVLEEDAATDDQGGQGDERPGLLLEVAVLKRRNCAEFDQLIRPITEARTTSSAAAAHAYFFGAGQGDQQEQAKRLRLLSRELELTAAHIRRVLE